MTAVPDAPSSEPHRALYRRFRAQRFGELVGQDPIVTTLRRAITGDRLKIQSIDPEVVVVEGEIQGLRYE